MSAAPPAPLGSLVISLDFELHWGIRDHTPIERCREHLSGVWRAVPALLDLFREYRIHATWATVGALFARDRDELEAFAPAVRPTYRDERLSPYPSLRELGRGEEDDPWHFAPSLVRAIAETPGQELGTHTFSHYYTLEAGQTLAQFVADLRAANALAAAHGHALRSIVFPRNQYGPEHLAALPELGIVAYRGAAPGWLNTPGAAADERRRRRALRLADTYLPVPSRAAAAPGPRVPGLTDVPASRFLRPYSPRLRHLEPLRLRRITGELGAAARAGRDYHLWWHPHNFGSNLEQNLGFLRRVLDAFSALRDRGAMGTATMLERAQQISLART